MYRFIILLLIVPSFVFSQKVKKENFGYYNYVQPRFSTVLDNSGPYFLSVELTGDDAFRRKLFEDALEIRKFSKAGMNDKAGFTVSIVEAPFKFGPSEKNSYDEKVKEGGKEVTRKMYYYTGTMGYHYTMKVLDAEGNEVFREIVSGSEKTRGRSSPSLTGAHDHFVKDKLQFTENVVKKSAEQLSSKFNEHFVDLEKTIHVRAAYIQGRQFDYSGFEKSYEDLKLAYEALNTGSGLTTETDALLEGCIKFWTGFLNEATPEDKKSRINADVAAAAHHDLALAYFFRRDFVNAAMHFEQAEKYDNSIVAGIQNWVYVSRSCAERQQQH